MDGQNFQPPKQNVYGYSPPAYINAKPGYSLNNRPNPPFQANVSHYPQPIPLNPTGNPRHRLVTTFDNLTEEPTSQKEAANVNASPSTDPMSSRPHPAFAFSQNVLPWLKAIFWWSLLWFGVIFVVVYSSCYVELYTDPTHSDNIAFYNEMIHSCARHGWKSTDVVDCAAVHRWVNNPYWLNIAKATYTHVTTDHMLPWYSAATSWIGSFLVWTGLATIIQTLHQLFLFLIGWMFSPYLVAIVLFLSVYALLDKFIFILLALVNKALGRYTANPITKV